MQILISGHKGDTGSVLMDALTADGHVCTAFGMGDLPPQVDRLVHAAVKHPGTQADELIRSNINFLQEVVATALSKQVQDIVFLSSASVYSKSTVGKIDESFSSAPDNLYAISKLLGECYLVEKKIKGVSLRLPAILEVRKCNNFMSKLLRCLEANEPVTITNADSLFNAYADPYDIARFITDIPNLPCMRPLNFAVPAVLTLKETVYLLRELCSSKSIVHERVGSVPMKTYSTESLLNLFDFSVSEPKEALERWVIRRRHFLNSQKGDI